MSRPLSQTARATHPLLRESAPVELHRVPRVQAAALRQPGSGRSHLTHRLVENRFEARHARVDEFIGLSPQSGSLGTGFSPHLRGELLRNSDHLAVLRKICSMIPSIGHDASGLCFAFRDFERRHVDDLLRISDLIRQIRDHIVDRG